MLATQNASMLKTLNHYTGVHNARVQRRMQLASAMPRSGDFDSADAIRPLAGQEVQMHL
jgi:hypothetical protein